MNNVTVSCLCGDKINVDFDAIHINNNFIDCPNCPRSYYVYYNAETESYEYDLIRESTL